MIWLCGDTHGEIDLYKVEDFFENLDMYEEVTKRDYLIILGDAGVCWDRGLSDEYVQNTLHNLPCTVLWLDGNHENFDAIEEYPIEEWHGGEVQFIKEDVIHLMRGQIYDIDGMSFFTFGGGNSIDKSIRTPYVTWWPDEMPSNYEYEIGLKNLEKNGNKVDFILTHSCPRFVAEKLVTYIESGEEPLQRYFEEISQIVDFGMWYFGHWHIDETIDGTYRALWNDIVELNSSDYV